MKPEDTPGYAGLYGEVVTEDTYRLRSLRLAPDVIFDIGANIGVFTRYARGLFPRALIVAVEPHPENFAILTEHTPPNNILFLRAAIGIGQVWRSEGAANGSGETYLTVMPGFDCATMSGNPRLHPVDVPTIMLDEICLRYVSPDQRLLIKCDCEGSENAIFNHPRSMAVVQRAAFVAMELHRYACAGSSSAKSSAAAEAFVEAMKQTHRCEREHVMFWAWRKPDGEPIASRSEFGQILRTRGLLGQAAEIGVASGYFARSILDWGMKHLFLVDPWKRTDNPGDGQHPDEWHEHNYQQCLRNLCGCEERATLLRMTSAEAVSHVPDASLDFCNIDACHAYEEIRNDLSLWWRKMRSGGILAAHDYLAPEYGVNRAVREFSQSHGLVVHVVIEHEHDASCWMEKP